jgi:hypothetical protein
VRGKQVFLLFFYDWYSDLEVPCSNVTVHEQFYLQKESSLEAFLLREVYSLACLYKI